MLSHRLENGVLVLTVQDAPGLREQNLAALISDLVHVHDPTPTVVVLGTVVPDEVIEAVMEAYRRCRQSDVLISVATPSAPARRTLQAQAASQGGGVVVHARVDTAVRMADAAGARRHLRDDPFPRSVPRA